MRRPWERPRGFIALEMARVDASIATFYGVHSGLAMGSIHLCGSEEQKQRWLPPMQRLEKSGAFGLTEPEVGSGAAGGLTTSARLDGEGQSGCGGARPLRRPNPAPG
jgi:glutaryl-CoA dehydrogenase